MKILDKLINIYSLYTIRKFNEIEGWLSANEALALYNLARNTPSEGIIVEIGTWKGKSTYCLSKGIKERSKIYVIDPFDGSGEQASAKLYREKKGDKPLFNQFFETMSDLNVIDKIVILQGYSSQFTKSFQKIDLLFIDGDHSIEGCLYDYENFSPYIVSGGYIVFHDYDPARNDLGPTYVIHNKVIKSEKYNFINQIDSIWVARKI